MTAAAEVHDRAPVTGTRRLRRLSCVLQRDWWVTLTSGTLLGRHRAEAIVPAVHPAPATVAEAAAALDDWLCEHGYIVDLVAPGTAETGLESGSGIGSGPGLGAPDVRAMHLYAEMCLSHGFAACPWPPREVVAALGERLAADRAGAGRMPAGIADADALIALLQAPGPLTNDGLAAAMVRAKSTASRKAGDLEAAGLVTRTRVGRELFIALTEAGAAVARTVLPEPDLGLERASAAASVTPPEPAEMWPAVRRAA